MARKLGIQVLGIFRQENAVEAVIVVF